MLLTSQLALTLMRSRLSLVMVCTYILMFEFCQDAKFSQSAFAVILVVKVGHFFDRYLEGWLVEVISGRSVAGYIYIYI